MVSPMSSPLAVSDDAPAQPVSPKGFGAAGWSASILFHLIIAGMIFYLADWPEPAPLVPPVISAELVVLAAPVPDTKDANRNAAKPSHAHPEAVSPAASEAASATAQTPSEQKPPPTPPITRSFANVPPAPKRKPAVPQRKTKTAAERLPPQAEFRREPAETLQRISTLNGADQAESTAEAASHSIQLATSARPPRPVANGGNRPPRYPSAARRRGIEGKVLLAVSVSPDGLVKSVAVKKSSGARILDRAAQSTVRQWRFAPATRGGAPVPGKIEIPVTFRLEN